MGDLAVGEKGLQQIEKMPPGYKITSDSAPGTAQWDGVRPGYGLVWDPEKGVWVPPGFHGTDPTDPNRIFNPHTGQNGVWGDDKKQWIDAQTGKPIGYEQ